MPSSLPPSPGCRMSCPAARSCVLCCPAVTIRSDRTDSRLPSRTDHGLPCRCPARNLRHYRCPPAASSRTLPVRSGSGATISARPAPESAWHSGVRFRVAALRIPRSRVQNLTDPAAHCRSRQRSVPAAASSLLESGGSCLPRYRMAPRSPRCSHPVAANPAPPQICSSIPAAPEWARF